MVNLTKQNVKEIFGTNASIFLDEVNIKYHEQVAQKYLTEHPDDPIWEDSKVTGRQYYNKITEMIAVANDIMDGKLVPNLFDLLPIKKNGTFTANRKIPIFRNNISYGVNYYEYVDAGELVLCIIPHYTTLYDTHHDRRYDMSQPVSEKRARLALTMLSTGKKIVPLINKDRTINDIKTRAKYLKDEDVHPGCIYKEKSGTEYLYLGKIDFCHITPDYLDSYPHNPLNEYGHNYIRMSKKLKEWYDNCNSILDFCKKYAMQYKPYEMSISYRENPRKFTELVSDKFKDYNHELAGKRLTLNKTDEVLTFIDC